MPRKSFAAKSVGGKLPIARPDPPEHLDDPAAAVWRRVVASSEPGWFTPDIAGMLALFCQTEVTAQMLAVQTANVELMIREAPTEKKALAQATLHVSLSKRRDATIRTLVQLAMKLRLTLQARRDPTNAGRQAARASSGLDLSGGPLSVMKPWEFTGSA